MNFSACKVSGSNLFEYRERNIKHGADRCFE